MKLKIVGKATEQSEHLALHGNLATVNVYTHPFLPERILHLQELGSCHRVPIGNSNGCNLKL